MRVHLTLRSDNAKTGPIPVSTSTSVTCPDSCPFKSGGCYASHNPRGLGGHWQKVTSGIRGTDWDTFCAAVARFSPRTLWRHNQAGDLPGDGEKLDRKALAQLVAANKTAGARGFTYTHKPLRSRADRLAIANANLDGFAINLSANNPAHADRLSELRAFPGSGPIAPVVCVVLDTTVTHTPAGRPIRICPAQVRDDVTCAKCGLCALTTRRTIVGFLPHGNGARAVRTIASQTA